MQRNHALDGLRGIAALAVLGFHIGVPWLKGGHLGVDIFFVLSGYLITAILTKEFEQTGRIALGRFYVARALRLYPALFLFLAGYLLISQFSWPEQPAAANAALVALYLTDYSIPYWHQPEIIVHTWSLSVEEHFYLLWPIFLSSLVLKRDWLSRVILLAVLYVAATGWRIYHAEIGGWEAAYFPFDSRVSGLLLGALLGQMSGRYDLGKVSSAIGLIAGVTISLLLLTTEQDVPGLGLPVICVELATACLIIAFQHPGPLYKVYSIAPFVFTGKISYALYLWHLLIAHAVGEGPFWPTVPLIIILSFGCAAASWYSVEKYGTELRVRIGARTSMIKAPQS